jgi:iron complex outermembrane receptor protein
MTQTRISSFPKLADAFPKLAIAAALSAIALDGFAQATLEEVVVTAQHRAENLQDVPIAITAIGSEELRAADISDLNAISLRTPGFSMGTFNPAQPQLFIRGVGSNADGASEEQSVVVFLDGVYLGRTAGQAFDLFDLERIEVLRGPQGTLYGKNAAGGALNIVTQKPTEEFEGAVEVSGGDLGFFSTRAKVSGALGDNLAGKLSVSYKERDGYIDSAVAENLDNFNAYDSTGLRGQLLSRPSDSLELLLTADYSQDNRVSPGRNVGTEFLQAAIVAGGPFSPGFYQNMLTTEPRSDIETWGLSLQADWDLGSGTLTSITAYRETDADVLDIAFGVAYEFLGLGSLDNAFVETGEQFTQELRYAVDLNDTMFLQTGVYYLNEQVERDESLQILCGLLCGLPPTNPINLPTGRADQTNETNSYGAFAQIMWSINERLDLTLGGRYTYEEKEASNIGSPDGAFAILEPYDVQMSDSWNAFTPKVAINYVVTDDLTAYATVSTGFKSGGYQGLAPTGVAASTPFNEETVTNFEIGLKGTALDNTLRFSAAAFNMAYDDLQVLVLTVQDNGLPGPQLTANAGEAEIQGIELEAQWLIGEYLQLLGTYAYLDTEYTELDTNLAQFEGNALRNAPENAYSLSAIVDVPVGSGSINARADYTFKDDAFQDIPNAPEAAMFSYDVLNLRLAYAPANQRWEVAGWLKNALDEEYLLHNSVLNPGLAQLPLPAAPRTWGITATYNFGD